MLSVLEGKLFSVKPFQIKQERFYNKLAEFQVILAAEHNFDKNNNVIFKDLSEILKFVRLHDAFKKIGELSLIA